MDRVRVRVRVEVRVAVRAAVALQCCDGIYSVSQLVRAVNAREECHWPHTWQRFKQRSKGVRTSWLAAREGRAPYLGRDTLVDLDFEVPKFGIASLLWELWHCLVALQRCVTSSVCGGRVDG
jgi:hypothetical protein